jgi:signal transduction histidine kinase
VIRALTLRARLTLALALVFVFGGVLLIGLTTTLANRSIAQANAATSPAAAALERQLSAILADAAANMTKPGQSSAQPTSTPTASPASSEGKAKAQRNGGDLKQKIVAANSDYAAATRTDAVSKLVTESVAGAAVLVPLAGLLAWFVAGRSLRPIRSITAAARRTSVDRLSDRLGMTGPRDEITELADTFDAMMARLENAFEAQRRFVADASHELRTPLAVAATSIDVVLAKPDRTPAQLEAMAHDVRGALTRVERLVDSLLALTRSEQLDRAREPVDLATLAEDALDAQRTTILARRLSVTTALDESRTTGDPALLDRMVGNLVDNAVRHNIAGGRIEVRTAQTKSGVTLTVVNDGPAIPGEVLPQLREPFHRLHGRARTADTGLGLGLAIADAVCRAHRGTLRLRALPSGGIEATAELPTRDQPPA